MTDNIIKLDKNNILRFEIETNEGEKTGQTIEFQLDDIELPLKYQDLLEMDKKNKEQLRNKVNIIRRRQDVKGKKLLSKNEEDEIKAIKEFLNKEVEIYNMFLGERGVEKLLNGRKLSWTTLQEIDIIIDSQILPLLEKNTKNIKDQIKNKYDVSRITKNDEEKIEVIE